MLTRELRMLTPHSPMIVKSQDTLTLTVQYLNDQI